MNHAQQGKAMVMKWLKTAAFVLACAIALVAYIAVYTVLNTPAKSPSITYDCAPQLSTSEIEQDHIKIIVQTPTCPITGACP